jgi:flagellar motor switch/type III secretory pathway protein FliN
MADTAAHKSGSSRFAGFGSVPIRITIRAGKAYCSVAFLSDLKEGSVLRLDTQVGTPFDLLAGGRLLGGVEPVAGEDGVSIKLVSVAEDEDDTTD